jgi:acetoin:2,6-dichlorophenolindophenol oxidoreductase subunit alpha
VRQGEPALIHAIAYRWYGHFAHDSGAYRDPEAHRRALEKDPLERCRSALGLSQAELEGVDEDIENRVARALREAEAAPLPRPAEAFTAIQDLDAPWRR